MRLRSPSGSPCVGSSRRWIGCLKRCGVRALRSACWSLLPGRWLTTWRNCDLEELGGRWLADSYTVTISEAEATVENASSSLDRTVLFLRLIVVVAAIAAVVMGLALLDINRQLAGLYETVIPGAHHDDGVVLIDER